MKGGKDVDALCKHFGECGGCRRQDLPYAEQLARKSDELGRLFGEIWPHPIPVEPSPCVWNYRNKVDLNFSLKRYPEPPPPGFVRESLLGFKKRGRWFDPLDVEECRIGPEGLDLLVGRVREWMKSHELRAFDSRTQAGCLRELLVREGKRTGEKMVVLITWDEEFDRASFVEAVRDAYPATSIQWGLFKGLADVAAAERVEVLAGNPVIHERLEIPTANGIRPLHFRISPFSFFQTNTLGTERLYSLIRERVDSSGLRVMYDLYGGCGSVAMVCADLVETIHSVEYVESATLDGQHNVTVNGIKNIQFQTADVKNYLKALIAEGSFERESVVVVDPPRSGMVPKAVRRLVELRPRSLVYVSCSPKELARELPAFLEAYGISDLHAVDLFPHTDHVELLATFESL